MGRQARDKTTGFKLAVYRNGDIYTLAGEYVGALQTTHALELIERSSWSTERRKKLLDDLLRAGDSAIIDALQK